MSASTPSERQRRPLVEEVLIECTRQDEKFGSGRVTSWITRISLATFGMGFQQQQTPEAAVTLYHAGGTGTWSDILVEELTEAIEADNDEDLRAELVQVAAVAVQWIAAIDRRTA